MHDTHCETAYSGNGPDDALESLIRAAGDYVHPTDDLRPRTLERARLRCRQQRRAGGTALAALLLVLLLPSGHRQYDPIAPFGGLSISAATDPLERQTGCWQAGSNGLRAGVGPDWALVEIFTQLRRQQAELLHGVRATK
jgi:hypothetical protein